MANRWSAIYGNLTSLDSLFNESITPGLNEAISGFWANWQDLSLRPEDYSTRETLVGVTQNMTQALRNAADDLVSMQTQMDDFIGQEVSAVNDLLDEIAQINRQIQEHDIPGQNNANALYDRRALLVRQLSAKLDIDTVDNGGGRFTILTQAGHVLLDGIETFSLAFESAQSMKALTAGSAFEGEIYFEGADDFEYTIETVTGGFASGAGAAQFKVSLDGGATWLRDENGDVELFSARPEGSKVSVHDLTIWFGDAGDPTAGATGQLSVGDRFTIVPKKGLYWYETTSSKMNVTPEISFTGVDNARRVTGGSLAGYFNFRDNYVGRYREKLDAFAKAMIWEVNRLHTQGAGLEKFQSVTGTYQTTSDTEALGTSTSGLAYYDKLQSGGTMVYIYDTATGELASGASYGPLDFSDAAGIQTFDPATHSLDDVRDAFNRTFGSHLTASISNHMLQIDTDTGYEMAFGTDTTGILAALGVNTFFEGSDVSTFTVSGRVKNDLDFIAAGHVNGAGEANTGDNTQAVAIAQLQHRSVSIRTFFEGATSQSLEQYYNAMVATVGADTSGAKFTFEYNKALADDLNERQDAVAGVNLDEEMSNLIKYQHSYTAAAKLIQTADRLLAIVIGLRN